MKIASTKSKRAKKSTGVSCFTYDEAQAIERAIDGRRALGQVELFEHDETSCRIVIIPGASIESIRRALGEFNATTTPIDDDEFNRVRVVRAS